MNVIRFLSSFLSFLINECYIYVFILVNINIVDLIRERIDIIEGVIIGNYELIVNSRR